MAWNFRRTDKILNCSIQTVGGIKKQQKQMFTTIQKNLWKFKQMHKIKQP